MNGTDMRVARLQILEYTEDLEMILYLAKTSEIYAM